MALSGCQRLMVRLRIVAGHKRLANNAGPLEQLRYFDLDACPRNDDLTESEHLAICDHFDKIGFTRSQLDHRAAAHAQQFMHRHDRLAENDTDIDHHLVEIGLQRLPPERGNPTCIERYSAANMVNCL